MSQDRWTQVDEYLCGLLLPADPALEAALESSTARGLPAIQVSALQGRLLWLLARAQGARSILEIGTLGGYSTIWLARALPAGGRLVTLELDPVHAEVARENLARAGLADRVEVQVGPALESLDRLNAGHQGPFDFVFIDADKTGYPDYFTRALALSRPGTLIVADNVVRGGAVADAGSTDPSVQAVRRLYTMISNEPRVSATVLQTVGVKGYDGLVIALVTGGG
jgi:predicted O-methyltransferase YrrM